MTPLTFLLFLFGIGLLIFGADLLVRAASRLAAAAGIPPLVIGLTVVAFGTSSPELVVSIQSSASGQLDLALGNVVGSNISNILLILGISALIAPLAVPQQLVRQEVPLMIVVSALVVLFALDGVIGPFDSALLCLGTIVYTIYSIVQSRRESAPVAEEYNEEFGVAPVTARNRWPLHVLSVVVGLALLTLGSRWLVDGAVAFARVLGISEVVVGLTIVAVGTSLPEIAASVLASLRGERDIAVGNVIGSCLFNLLAVLGITGVIASEGIPTPATALSFDLPVMLAASVACLPIFINGAAILRWEGGLFLGYYVAYTVYLLLSATENTLLEPFRLVMVVFVIPLTIITVGVVLVRFLRYQRRQMVADQ